MKRTLITSSLLLSLAALGLACVPKPSADYSKDQLTKLTVTQELMRVLYHDLVPTWESVKKPSLTPADLKAMGAVASRVDAVATALGSKEIAGRYKGDFAGKAGPMGQAAREMEKGAAAKDEAAARKALDGINQACEGCHKDFR